LSSYKDYRNAPELPFTGVEEYKLIWQLSEGASTFEIGYTLPPEVTISIKDVVGGIIFDSGTLSGTGTYTIPAPYITVGGVIITMTVVGPCPITDAFNPDPIDFQTNIPIDGVTLSWINGTGTTDVEVWFGPNGRALKLYDGSAINSWLMGTLDYGTQYSWYIICKNDSCGVQSPDWTFSTVLDTNLVIDTIDVYPQELNNWTGSCNTSSKTQVSLVHGYNTEAGWMVFDLSAIPNNVVINSVTFNGYLYDNSWPYWSITPMGDVNPVTAQASMVFNQISSHSGEGIAYSYNEETETLSNDWLTRPLGSTVTLDLQNSLSKNWFAIGILDFDFSTSYYVKFQGWAEANKPFLRIIYTFHAVTNFQFSSDVDDGWNLVSIPGLLPGDQLVDDWWPFRDIGANVFQYIDSYQAVPSVNPGVGYWMKHSGSRTYDTGEEWPSEGIKMVRHDPINVILGWNIIGVYEELVPSSGLTTIPSGIMNGPVYGYSGAYFISSELNPGKGYWINFNADGQIIIPDAALKSNNESIQWIKDHWGKIIFSDASGRNYTLYAANGEADLSKYELPPAPPAGMFDIRYSSGRIAEDLYSTVQGIDMCGVSYPLKVRVENMDMRIVDETGKIINENLKAGEEIVISDAQINKLIVGGELLSTVYALEQNYPNPFNPSTTIEFSLPEDVSNARLSIYNTLGEKVAELVSTSLVAGKYSYEWNAKNVATGIYVYELRTEKFVSVKKMILLK